MGSRNIFYLVIATCFLGSSAFADCDTAKYDQTPPAKIIDKVNNGTVLFEWASDIDTSGDRSWIWHYVRNMNSRGLGYKWPKADLRRALGSPLEPGNTDCNRFYVTGPTAVDDNAPITFGTNDSIQRAAIFAEPKASAAQSTGSVIETSYRTSSGTVENVRVVVSTSEGKSDRDRWQIIVEQTPNIMLAIAAPRELSADQYSSLTEQLKADAPIKFDFKTLADLYSGKEVEDRLSQPFIVLRWGHPTKSAAIMSATSLKTISSDVMLFDRESRPFFATTVKLLVPNSAR